MRIPRQSRELLRRPGQLRALCRGAAQDGVPFQEAGSAAGALQGAAQIIASFSRARSAAGAVQGAAQNGVPLPEVWSAAGAVQGAAQVGVPLPEARSAAGAVQGAAQYGVAFWQARSAAGAGQGAAQIGVPLWQAQPAAGAVQGAAQDGVPLPEAGSAAGAAQRAVVDILPVPEGFTPPSSWLGPSREELRWAHSREGGEPWASRGHATAMEGLLGPGAAGLERGLPPLPGLVFTMGTRAGAVRQSPRGGGARRPARTTRAAAVPARLRGRSGGWPWRSVGRQRMRGRASASRVQAWG